MEREYLNLIGGKWGPAAAGATNPDRNPARTDEVVAVFPSAGTRGRHARGGGGGQGLPGLGAHAHAQARRDPPEGGRAARAAAGRGGGGAHARGRQDPRREQGRGRRAASASSATTRARRSSPRARCTGSASPEHVPLRRARAHRAGRPHHALELPGGHPDLEGRARPGLRQHRRLQAGGADAAHRLAPRRRARQGRPAPRRAEPGRGPRVADRPGPGGEPAHQGHQLHRLERGRARAWPRSARSAGSSSSSRWAARTRWSS